MRILVVHACMCVFVSATGDARVRLPGRIDLLLSSNMEYTPTYILHYRPTKEFNISNCDKYRAIRLYCVFSTRLNKRQSVNHVSVAQVNVCFVISTLIALICSSCRWSDMHMEGMSAKSMEAELRIKHRDV